MVNEMLKYVVSFCVTLFVAVSACAGTRDADVDQTVLPNGLTLITVEDHREPIVSITVWYHVGSKDEKPGRAGFAHLFEHIMFEGSENHKENFVKAVENAGGSAINGVTNQDRTAYFETVPVSSLDYVLWLEADRMAHLLGAVDQKILDGQRAVIENEKRQEDDANYAIAGRFIAENTYPVGHPYRKSVTGENVDLKAAALTDIREWFETYYGASNAVIVLAGDITPAIANEKIRKYFSGVPAGQPVAHQVAWVAKMSGIHRQTVQDRVPRPRIYKVWNIPESRNPDSVYLDLVSDVLARGKGSRLYRALVADGQLGDDVKAYVRLSEIGGQFRIETTARPDRSLDDLEKKLDSELERFLKEGPTAEELNRVKAQYIADYFRSIDHLGGLGSRSDRIAQGAVFGHQPEAYKLAFERVGSATPDDLKAAARRWLSDGVYVLDVLPFSFGKANQQAQTAQEPGVGMPAQFQAPQMQRATLSNGLKVVVAERHEVAMVNLWMSFNAGFTADPCDLPGTAVMTLAMIDGGTARRSGAQINEQLDSLGAELKADTNADQSILKLSALKTNLSASLDLFSDILLHPAFPQEEFELQRKQNLASITREENTPMFMALRALAGRLYRQDCPSASPFLGHGTPASMGRISADDVRHFYNGLFRPNNATLIIVGDTSLGEIKAKIESAFAGWKAAPVPARNTSGMQTPEKESVFLIDKPGAQQSFIVLAGSALPKTDPRELALEAVNDELGGNLSSRLNLDLREEKHWSYGLRSRLWDTRGARPFITYSSVQADKTADAINEIKKEMAAILSTKPMTDEQLAQIKASQILRLPASQETLDSVAQSIAELVHFDLSDDYLQSLQGRISALTAREVADAAGLLIQPAKMVWVIVGDKSKLESGLEKLGIANIQIVAAAQEVRF
jgi:zinc protease